MLKILERSPVDISSIGEEEGRDICLRLAQRIDAFERAGQPVPDYLERAWETQTCEIVARRRAEMLESGDMSQRGIQ